MKILNSSGETASPSSEFEEQNLTVAIEEEDDTVTEEFSGMETDVEIDGVKFFSSKGSQHTAKLPIKPHLSRKKIEQKQSCQKKILNIDSNKCQKLKQRHFGVYNWMQTGIQKLKAPLSIEKKKLTGIKKRRVAPQANYWKKRFNCAMSVGAAKINKFQRFRRHQELKVKWGIDKTDVNSAVGVGDSLKNNSDKISNTSTMINQKENNLRENCSKKIENKPRRTATDVSESCEDDSPVSRCSHCKNYSEKLDYKNNKKPTKLELVKFWENVTYYPSKAQIMTLADKLQVKCRAIASHFRSKRARLRIICRKTGSNCMDNDTRGYITLDTKKQLIDYFQNVRKKPSLVETRRLSSKLGLTVQSVAAWFVHARKGRGLVLEGGPNQSKSKIDPVQSGSKDATSINGKLSCEQNSGKIHKESQKNKTETITAKKVADMNNNGNQVIDNITESKKYLMDYYDTVSKNPNLKEKRRLAKKLGLKTQSVSVFFVNSNAKGKKRENMNKIECPLLLKEKGYQKQFAEFLNSKNASIHDEHNYGKSVNENYKSDSQTHKNAEASGGRNNAQKLSSPKESNHQYRKMPNSESTFKPSNEMSDIPLITGVGSNIATKILPMTGGSSNIATKILPIMHENRKPNLATSIAKFCEKSAKILEPVRVLKNTNGNNSSTKEISSDSVFMKRNISDIDQESGRNPIKSVTDCVDDAVISDRNYAGAVTTGTRKLFNVSPSGLNLNIPTCLAGTKCNNKKTLKPVELFRNTSTLKLQENAENPFKFREDRVRTTLKLQENAENPFIFIEGARKRSVLSRFIGEDSDNDVEPITDITIKMRTTRNSNKNVNDDSDEIEKIENTFDKHIQVWEASIVSKDNEHCINTEMFNNSTGSDLSSVNNDIDLFRTMYNIVETDTDQSIIDCSNMNQLKNDEKRSKDLNSADVNFDASNNSKSSEVTYQNIGTNVFRISKDKKDDKPVVTHNETCNQDGEITYGYPKNGYPNSEDTDDTILKLKAIINDINPGSYVINQGSDVINRRSDVINQGSEVLNQGNNVQMKNDECFKAYNTRGKKYDYSKKCSDDVSTCSDDTMTCSDDVETSSKAADKKEERVPSTMRRAKKRKPCSYKHCGNYSKAVRSKADYQRLRNYYITESDHPDTEQIRKLADELRVKCKTIGDYFVFKRSRMKRMEKDSMISCSVSSANKKVSVVSANSIGSLNVQKITERKIDDYYVANNEEILSNSDISLSKELNLCGTSDAMDIVPDPDTTKNSREEVYDANQELRTSRPLLCEQLGVRSTNKSVNVIKEGPSTEDKVALTICEEVTKDLDGTIQLPNVYEQIHNNYQHQEDSEEKAAINVKNVLDIESRGGNDHNYSCQGVKGLIDQPNNRDCDDGTSAMNNSEYVNEYMNNSSEFVNQDNHGTNDAQDRNNTSDYVNDLINASDYVTEDINIFDCVTQDANRSDYVNFENIETTGDVNVVHRLDYVNENLQSSCDVIEDINIPDYAKQDANRSDYVNDNMQRSSDVNKDANKPEYVNENMQSSEVIEDVNRLEYVNENMQSSDVNEELNRPEYVNEDMQSSDVNTPEYLNDNMQSSDVNEELNRPEYVNEDMQSSDVNRPEYVNEDVNRPEYEKENLQSTDVNEDVNRPEYVNEDTNTSSAVVVSDKLLFNNQVTNESMNKQNILREMYKAEMEPNDSQLQFVADILNVSVKHVALWFKHAKRKYKNDLHKLPDCSLERDQNNNAGGQSGNDVEYGGGQLQRTESNLYKFSSQFTESRISQGCSEDSNSSHQSFTAEDGSTSNRIDKRLSMKCAVTLIKIDSVLDMIPKRSSRLDAYLDDYLARGGKDSGTNYTSNSSGAFNVGQFMENHSRDIMQQHNVTRAENSTYIRNYIASSKHRNVRRQNSSYGSYSSQSSSHHHNSMQSDCEIIENGGDKYLESYLRRASNRSRMGKQQAARFVTQVENERESFYRNSRGTASAPIDIRDTENGEEVSNCSRTRFDACPESSPSQRNNRALNLKHEYLTTYQECKLKEMYSLNPNPSLMELRMLSHLLNINIGDVVTWYTEKR